MLKKSFSKQTKKTPKVLFLNPSVRSYRVHLYDGLNKEMNTEFLFYHSETWIEKEYPEMKSWRYSILKEIPFVGYSRGVAPSLIKHLLTKDYDVAINQNVLSFASHIGFLIAKLRGKKWISWEENWIYPTTPLAKLIYYYNRWILKNSDACIVAGSKTTELLTQIGVKKERIFTAPNSAADLKKLTDVRGVNKIRKELGLDKHLTFSFVGRLTPEKGLVVLINAFNKLNQKHKKIKLMIIGYPEKNSNYFKQIKDLAAQNKNIIFVGKQTGKDLANHISASDVFVLPSIFFFQRADCTESWGMVMNEALSCGKAALASTAVGAAYDLIKDGVNGFIFKENNERSLLNAMEKVFKKDIKKMGEESRRIITEKYNDKNMLLGFQSAINFATRTDTSSSKTI
jgi:glycosyltransferase involved in cell wall biosynthesis